MGVEWDGPYEADTESVEFDERLEELLNEAHQNPSFGACYEAFEFHVQSSRCDAESLGSLFLALDKVKDQLGVDNLRKLLTKYIKQNPANQHNMSDVGTDAFVFEAAVHYIHWQRGGHEAHLRCVNAFMACEKPAPKTVNKMIQAFNSYGDESDPVIAGVLEEGQAFLDLPTNHFTR